MVLKFKYKRTLLKNATYFWLAVEGEFFKNPYGYLFFGENDEKESIANIRVHKNNRTA